MTIETHLVEETLQVWNHSRVHREADLPGAGDVLVLERTAHFDVEWAVLAKHSMHSDLLLIVAADGQPFAGSDDVEVPWSASRGALVLRCRFGGWVDAQLLAGATRTTTLSKREVAHARDHWAKVERETVTGSIFACEVDDDLEYQDLLAEVLKPAWQAFLWSGGAPVEEVNVDDCWNNSVPPLQRLDAQLPVQETAENPAVSRHLMGRPTLALAAIIFLAFGAGLFWSQQRELTELHNHYRIERAEHFREAGRLRSEREELEARHERVLAEIARELAQVESRSRQTVERLRREIDLAQREVVVRNPVAISLGLPNGRRGEPEQVPLTAEASHVLFFMVLEENRVLENSTPKRYRAELRHGVSKKRLWENHELKPSRLRELRIGLPRALLPAGEYLLRILEEVEGKSELVVEYPLLIHTGETQK